LLIDEGFPRPQTQIPVLGPDGCPRYYLDMGWKDLMVAVEYDGVQHADQLGYDIVRSEYIAGVGWTTIRVAAGHRRPDIVARVQRAWDAKLLSDRDIS
jgi:very-short-patch-repair endonuclease